MEICWEMSNGPQHGDLEGEFLGNYGYKLGASDGVFLGNFQLDPDWVIWTEFGQKFQMDPSWVVCTNFWLEILNGLRIGDLE